MEDKYGSEIREGDLLKEFWPQGGNTINLVILTISVLTDVKSITCKPLKATPGKSFLQEVKKARGKQRPLTVARIKALRDAHAISVKPVGGLLGEAAELERRASEIVNAAFGPSREEIELMWKTGPPWMPRIHSNPGH